MTSFFSELKRRNVFKVAVAYIIVGWLIMQVGDTLGPALLLPEWINSALAFFIILGFPLAMFFAWAFEMTPEGIKKEKDVDRSQSVNQLTSQKLNGLIIGLLVVALGYFTFDKFVLDPARDAEMVEAAQQAAPAVEPSQASATPAPDEKSVAVLPFQNMSSDPEQEYFSDGITEEIINALVKIPGLSVPARTSVFAFKGEHRDIRGIGQELGVAHVLEGSIRSQNNQVRITAQLIKVDDGFHLWSDTFDRELSNIFIVQEEIAAAISQVLVGELGLADSAVPNQTRKMDAYDLYLQGRDILRNRGSSSLSDFGLAISLFETATEIDPDYAPTWAALAITHQVTDYLNFGQKSQDKAIETANYALSLDPQNVEAMTAIASALRDTWRWAEADQYFEQAIAIDPGSAELLEDYAEFYGMTGNLEQYLAIGERGYAVDSRLEPLKDAYFSALVANDRAEEALELLDLGVGQNTDMNWSLAAPLIALGRTDEAIKSLKAMEAKDERDLLMIAVLENSEDSVAVEGLRGNISSNRLGAYLGTNISPEAVLSMAGEVDSAVDNLIEVRKELGWGNIEGIWSPLYSRIRQHERFEEFLELVKLPDYWDEAGWPDQCRRDEERIVCQ